MRVLEILAGSWSEEAPLREPVGYAELRAFTERHPAGEELIVHLLLDAPATYRDPFDPPAMWQEVVSPEAFAHVAQILEPLDLAQDEEPTPPLADALTATANFEPTPIVLYATLRDEDDVLLGFQPLTVQVRRIHARFTTTVVVSTPGEVLVAAADVTTASVRTTTYPGLWPFGASTGRFVIAAQRGGLRTSDQSAAEVLQAELAAIERGFVAASMDATNVTYGPDPANLLPRQLLGVRHAAVALERHLGDRLRHLQSSNHQLTSGTLRELELQLEKDRNLAGSVAAEALSIGDSLSSTLAAQQLRLAQRQADETERFQRLATVLASVILVPTLIAGVFGANVRVPGEGQRSGFWSMLLIMGGTAGVVLAVMTRPRRRQDVSRSRRSWLRTSVAAVGVIASGSGVALLASVADPPSAAPHPETIVTVIERTLTEVATVTVERPSRATGNRQQERPR